MKKYNLTTACNYLTTAPQGDYSWNQYQWIPTVYPTTYIYNNTTTPPADFTVRKVTNGFICWFGAKEYVFESIEKLTKFMTKELKD